MSNKKKSLKTLVYIAGLLFAVLIIEITVFNLAHYISLNSNPRESVTIEATAIETDGIISLTDVNKVIHTLYIKPIFVTETRKSADIKISWLDEDSTRSHTVTLINGYQNSFFIPIGTRGEVENLSIAYNKNHISISKIEFNVPLPFRFHLLRFISVCIIAVLCYAWKKHDLGKIWFDPSSKAQSCISGFVVVFFIGILFLITVFSQDFGYIPGSENRLKWNRVLHQSNNDMVQAIRQKQLHLPIEVNDGLLNSDRIYDTPYLNENKVQYKFDHVFFEGRYYSYFGIVPVIFFYLPYSIVTGKVFCSAMATLLFSSLASIGLFFLYRELILRYLLKIPFAIYLTGVFCLMSCSNVVFLAAFPRVYESSIAAGLMLAVWGTFLVIRSVKTAPAHKQVSDTRFNFIALFFGALFLALSVGCRPSMMFYSFLVPVIVLPHISIKRIKPILVIAVPYLVVASGLMWYNWQRFGSITEFGATYQLTLENLNVANDISALGFVRRIYNGLYLNFLLLPRVLPTFPFIRVGSHESVFPGFFYVGSSVVGIFALPVSWFLLGAFRARKFEALKTKPPLISAMLVISLIIIVFSACIVGAAGRYQVDFLWLIVISSLLCMGILYQGHMKDENVEMVFRRICYVTMGISSFTMIAVGIINQGNGLWVKNPAVFQYLADMFMFF
ncbi:MAG: hypothetical protein FWG87_08180 [Defluviitaleaceae bacterium]|nr:hypothetical protein [Defluviitaleaceae bacterium]